MPNTRIRQMRQAAGLTLQDVADLVGATSVTVGRWEREPQRVTVPVLRNLARAIGCTEADLLGIGVRPNTHVDEWASDVGVPPEHYAILRVASDAMEPTILRGDLCDVDGRYKAVKEAGLYAFSTTAEMAAVVRAHMIAPGEVRVICDNPLYRYEKTFKADELQVIGKVVGFHRKI